MPSTDRKLELTPKASMAQPVSQPAVCCNGLKRLPWSEHVARQEGVIGRERILLAEINIQEYLEKPHGDRNLDLG